MEQIKIFEAKSAAELETSVNEWLSQQGNRITVKQTLPHFEGSVCRITVVFVKAPPLPPPLPVFVKV